MRVRLYHTLGCHLCELAEAMLLAETKSHHLQLELQDIAENDALIEHYGVRIPVVQRLDSGAELSWPFAQETLQSFLGAEVLAYS